jgi:hypothetical protein
MRLMRKLSQREFTRFDPRLTPSGDIMAYERADTSGEPVGVGVSVGVDVMVGVGITVGVQTGTGELVGVGRSMRVGVGVTVRKTAGDG